MSHGCNVNIKGVDNINSHMHDNTDVNVMNLLSINQRINRFYDRRNYHQRGPVRKETLRQKG
jgi:hypothetical protein